MKACYQSFITPKKNQYICLMLIMLWHSPSWAATSWSLVTTPQALGSTAQSIGSYTNGCISGASALPINGAGYQLMRLSRQRMYGHPVLTHFIQQLGERVAQEKIGVLLIGDLGQPRGGPTLTGHRSHQTGLDVDIWFLHSQQAQQRLLSSAERETMQAASVVKTHSAELNLAQWTVRQEKVLHIAAQMPEVERIFVNPVIKRELCKRYNAAQWLRKIRPWWKHDDHFHVRIACPANNTHCEKQAPLPMDSGCDAGLAWWFSAEASKPAAKAQQPSLPPPLPLLCKELLH
jgi:penicillin-insensitive murein endopeptidase